jgi:hypothetical protein
MNINHLKKIWKVKYCTRELGNCNLILARYLTLERANL